MEAQHGPQFNPELRLLYVLRFSCFYSVRSSGGSGFLPPPKTFVWMYVCCEGLGHLLLHI